MGGKPKAFVEPTSALSSFRTIDLVLRVLSTLVCIAILALGGVSAAKSGVFLIGILGPPAACVILWSILQFGLSTSRFEYMNFRSRFRMVIGVLITIGFAIADICLGLFRQWWADSESGFNYFADNLDDNKSPNEKIIINLTIAGLSLGCLATRWTMTQ
ncbi:hypothetical protein E4U43_002265 [Claviceps pusilla]|uniref:Uncharacterized protein n=1 Tax=Claviceps pusilla TaxID=123648 RepID=A0A9P7SW91_9HYPO|nr:hypothetical protein E4U43_002265 [Claviceps pusilla]